MASSPVTPMACRPWTLDGLCDDLIVSHHENNYGSAERALNAVRDRLATLDLETAPDYQFRSLKREELAAMGSVALHEVYFDSLGGDVGCAVAATLRERGFDARYLSGGLSAWYAAGGARALRPAI